MPYFKRTGMISHRHPFYGFGDQPYSPADIYDYSPSVDYPYLLGEDKSTNNNTEQKDNQKIISKQILIDALVTGISSYSVSKAFGAPSEIATKIGFTLAGLDIFSKMIFELV